MLSLSGLVWAGWTGWGGRHMYDAKRTGTEARPPLPGTVSAQAAQPGYARAEVIPKSACKYTTVRVAIDRSHLALILVVHRGDHDSIGPVANGLDHLVLEVELEVRPGCIHHPDRS